MENTRWRIWWEDLMGNTSMADLRCHLSEGTVSLIIIIITRVRKTSKLFLLYPLCRHPFLGRNRSCKHNVSLPELPFIPTYFPWSLTGGYITNHHYRLSHIQVPEFQLAYDGPFVWTLRIAAEKKVANLSVTKFMSTGSHGFIHVLYCLILKLL